MFDPPTPDLPTELSKMAANHAATHTKISNMLTERFRDTVKDDLSRDASSLPFKKKKKSVIPKRAAELEMVAEASASSKFATRRQSDPNQMKQP